MFYTILSKKLKQISYIYTVEPCYFKLSVDKQKKVQDSW